MLNSWQSALLGWIRSWQKPISELKMLPPDPWPGESEIGLAICQKRDWSSIKKLLSEKEVQDFFWLRHLRALGDTNTRKIARSCIIAWCKDSKQDWDPVVVSNRLVNWLSLFDFFGASAEISFRKQFFKILSQHQRYLWKIYAKTPNSFARFCILKALLYTAFSSKSMMQWLIANLWQEINNQIVDGEHISKNPIMQLIMLRDLIDIRLLFKRLGYQEAEMIQEVISQLTPMVRMLRHGDGVLATFGQSRKFSAHYVERVLSLADLKGRGNTTLKLPSFERFLLKNSLILLNSSPMIGINPGTGLFNFEWSIGHHRVIDFAYLVLESKDGFIEPSDPTDREMDIEKHKKHLLWFGAYQQDKFHHSRQLYLTCDPYTSLRGEDRLEVFTDGIAHLNFVLPSGTNVTDCCEKNLKAILEMPAGDKWYVRSDICAMLDVRNLDRDNIMLSLSMPFERRHGVVWRWSINRQ